MADSLLKNTTWADPTAALSQAIAAVDDIQAWMHPLGFIHVRLQEELSGVRTRLHIWPKAIAVNECGSRERIHNHSFEFVSHILAGMVLNCPYDVRLDGGGPLRICSVTNGVGFANLEPTEKRCVAYSTPSAEYVGGDSYEMKAARFHDALGLSDFTATLVLAVPKKEVSSFVLAPEHVIKPWRTDWPKLTSHELRDTLGKLRSLIGG